MKETNWVTSPRLSPKFELMEALFAAEALRLNEQAAMAYDHCAAIAQRAAKHDHQLEHAQALLGMAESKRLLDRETLSCAMAIYEQIGAASGRVRAHCAGAGRTQRGFATTARGEMHRPGVFV